MQSKNYPKFGEKSIRRKGLVHPLLETERKKVTIFGLYLRERIISQWFEVLDIDLRICSNIHFICPQTVDVIVIFKFFSWMFAAPVSPAVEKSIRRKGLVHPLLETERKKVTIFGLLDKEI
jgi:hypothetical protein